MSQEAVIEKLLPVEPAEIPPTENVEYLYEPDDKCCFRTVLFRVLSK